MKDLRTALTELDVENDNHWTTEGLPKLDVLKFIMGVGNVSRADVDAVAPVFTRTNLVIPEEVKPEMAQSAAPEEKLAQTVVKEQIEETQRAAKPLTMELRVGLSEALKAFFSKAREGESVGHIPEMSDIELQELRVKYETILEEMLHADKLLDALRLEQTNLIDSVILEQERRMPEQDNPLLTYIRSQAKEGAINIETRPVAVYKHASDMPRVKQR